MADNKKYYYLKLKDDFFESDELIFLESMQDGYKYSNILLKLFLRSLKKDGRLMFTDVIPYNSEMLAKLIRHDVGTIEKALQIFEQLKLIEILDNGAIYMLDIQNFVGESSTEADRKRCYRAKISAEKQGQGHLTAESPDISPPEIENRDKRLEIEKDIDKSGKPTKHKYGEYKNILLTDEEKERLIAEFGQYMFDKVIAFYSPYKYEKKYKTGSDNLSIRRWVIEAVKEREGKNGTANKSNTKNTNTDWGINSTIL
jgi:predicted phage replisome organizer